MMSEKSVRLALAMERLSCEVRSCQALATYLGSQVGVKEAIVHENLEAQLGGNSHCRKGQMTIRRCQP